MKSATIVKIQNKNHLKVVKNSEVSTKKNIHKIYINTLEPYFKYKNSKGDEVIPVSSYL
jgi:hypothetical protein